MTHAEILHMPLAQKLDLMESLWESLGSDAVPQWHQKVLDERAIRMAQGDEPVAGWDEVKQRIRAQTRK